MSVYFAKVGRYIKVGFSETPERRVANLWKSQTRYSRPLDCPLVEPVLLATIPGRLSVETACHTALDDFAAGGEFFVDEPAVREFIALAQTGQIQQVTRIGGPFVPVSAITDQDRAALRLALDDMFVRRAS